MKARDTLHTEKFNAPAATPLAEDVEKLHSAALLPEGDDERKSGGAKCATLWYDLCTRLTAAYILLFNRGRPRELSCRTVGQNLERTAKNRLFQYFFLNQCNL